MKKYILLQILPILSAIIIISMAACSNADDADPRLDLAESLMESRPDSALGILKDIFPSDIKSNRRKARLALLTSMALDKNYIDTTSFDVLQPAIDYYLKEGSADEKLKTYYYQGIIYQNAGKDDLAMQAFLNGSELEGELLDSIVLARLLIAQGVLYLKQYRNHEFVDNNIKAAEIYGKIGKKGLQLNSYIKAMNGELMLKDKLKADSLANICLRLSDRNLTSDRFLLRSILNYNIIYGNPAVVDSLLQVAEDSGLANSISLVMAKGYMKTGKAEKALQYLQDLKVPPKMLDSLTYLAVKSSILESCGDYKGAFYAYKDYDYLQAAYHDAMLKDGLFFSEKKHEMEIESLKKLQKKDGMLKLSIGISMVMLCIALLIYYIYRLNKAGRQIAEREADNLRLSQDLLNKKHENMKLEVRDKELTAEKLQLEADNLRLELTQLEEEHTRLTSLLDDRKEMEAPMQEAIRMRLEMLNSLLAKEITDNDAYAKPYREWIDSIRSDRKAFMDSTRIAFCASHPKFIRYLEEHELTEDEINYVCLYALGLRGKEVGEYIRLRRHYNVSSDIRKKLGIDEHSANLGPYIRKLLNSIQD